MLFTFTVTFTGMAEPIEVESAWKLKFAELLDEVLEKVNATSELGRTVTLDDIEVSPQGGTKLRPAEFSSLIDVIAMKYGKEFTIALKTLGGGPEEAESVEEFTISDLKTEAPGIKRDETLGPEAIDDISALMEREKAEEEFEANESKLEAMREPSEEEKGGKAGEKIPLPIPKPSPSPGQARLGARAVGVGRPTGMAAPPAPQPAPSGAAALARAAPDTTKKPVPVSPARKPEPAADMNRRKATSETRFETEKKAAPSPAESAPRKKDQGKEKAKKELPSAADELTKELGNAPQPPPPLVQSQQQIQARPAESRGLYEKNVALDYFSVMNPQNYYPIVVDIADAEQADKGITINPLTGEQKVQLKEKVAFEVPRVTVRPVFPGCSVAPESQLTDLRASKDVLTFYVTPLVQGDIRGSIEFLSAAGKVVHRIAAPSKVKNPHYAKIITLYGAIASLGPEITQAAGIDIGLGNKILTLFPALSGSIIQNMTLGSLIAFVGILGFIVVGIIYAAAGRPKNKKITYTLGDFRFEETLPQQSIT
jgi:hypothetical protein